MENSSLLCQGIWSGHCQSTTRAGKHFGEGVQSQAIYHEVFLSKQEPPPNPGLLSTWPTPFYLQQGAPPPQRLPGPITPRDTPPPPLDHCLAKQPCRPLSWPQASSLLPPLTKLPPHGAGSFLREALGLTALRHPSTHSRTVSGTQ